MVGQPAGRPTLCTGRPGRSTVPNRELGTFSRSTGRSTDLLLRSTGPVDRYCLVHVVHVLALRSTGPVDCASASADGRPPGRPCACFCRQSTGRSTVLLLKHCFCCYCSEILDFVIRRLFLDFLPLQFSTSVKISSNLSRSLTYPSLSPGEIDTGSRRNRPRTKSTHDLHQISTRSPPNRQKIPRRTWEALIPLVVSRQQPQREKP